MKRSTFPLVVIAALGLALFASFAQAEIVLYSNDAFSGSNTAALDGTTPSTTIGTNTWTASGDWHADGSIAGGGSNSDDDDDDNAFLAFTPETGKIYTLSAALTRPSGGSSNGWVAIGFAKTNNTAGSFWGNDTEPWVLYRPDSNVDSFLGPATGGSADEGNHPGPITLTIELDTTATQWTAEWFIDSASVRTATYSTNPTIGYVGLGRENGYSSDFSSFSLIVIPEPGTLLLALAAVAGLLLVRRRR